MKKLIKISLIFKDHQNQANNAVKNDIYKSNITV